MTAFMMLAGAVAYAAMVNVGRPFAFAFALLTAAAVPVIGLG